MPRKLEPFQNFEFITVEAKDFMPLEDSAKDSTTYAFDDDTAYLLAVADGHFVGWLHFEENPIEGPDDSVMAIAVMTHSGYGYLRRGVATALLQELRDSFPDHEPEQFVTNEFFHVGAWKAWERVFGSDHHALSERIEIPPESRAESRDWRVHTSWDEGNESRMATTLKADGVERVRLEYQQVGRSKVMQVQSMTVASGADASTYAGGLLDELADRGFDLVVDRDTEGRRYIENWQRQASIDLSM